MGLWGSIKSAFSATPGRDESRQYNAPNYTGGDQFKKNQSAAGQAYHDSAMAYMQRDPGFSERDKRDMYLQPAEQSRQSERSTLKRMNQGSSFGGSYRGGGRVRGRGQVMSQYGAGRADMQRQVRTSAAQAALIDRANQVAVGRDMTQMYGQQELSENAMRNNFDMGLNQLDEAAWRTNLGQYNNELGQSLQYIGTVQAQGGGGGGGGMGGMGGGGGGGMGGPTG